MNSRGQKFGWPGLFIAIFGASSVFNHLPWIGFPLLAIGIALFVIGGVMIYRENKALVMGDGPHSET